LHHLAESDTIGLLSTLARAARHAVLVDDLVRGRLGYFLAQVGCRVLSRSPIVRYDGPVSVLGGSYLGEVKRCAAQAGLAKAIFKRDWPERYLMCWKRPR